MTESQDRGVKETSPKKEVLSRIAVELEHMSLLEVDAVLALLRQSGHFQQSTGDRIAESPVGGRNFFLTTLKDLGDEMVALAEENTYNPFAVQTACRQIGKLFRDEVTAIETEILQKK